jgi:hypothetical protein
VSRAPVLSICTISIKYIFYLLCRVFDILSRLCWVVAVAVGGVGAAAVRAHMCAYLSRPALSADDEMSIKWPCTMHISASYSCSFLHNAWVSQFASHNVVYLSLTKP